MKYWIQFPLNLNGFSLFTTNSAKEEEAVPKRCFKIPKLLYTILTAIKKWNS